jgi:hypothetical protein
MASLPRNWLPISESKGIAEIFGDNFFNLRNLRIFNRLVLD